MKHFQTEQNQENRPFMQQVVLNMSSDNDVGTLGKNVHVLLINANSFDHSKLLLYVILNEEQIHYLLVMVRIHANHFNALL